MVVVTERPSDDRGGEASMHVRVGGVVQGVGYRAFVAETARALGVRGWVANEQNGSVIVRAAGTPDAITALRGAISAGPRGARVESIAELATTQVGRDGAFRIARDPDVVNWPAQPDRVSLERRVLSTIVDVPDFPRPGILFKDISPVLADGRLFADVVGALGAHAAEMGATAIGAIESRGFLLGAPAAVVAGVGVVMIRKAGKLPRETHVEQYALEYGAGALGAHAGGCERQRIVLVDDVLATGGTAAAAGRLIERAGGVVVGAVFLLELAALGGRERLSMPLTAIAKA